MSRGRIPERIQGWIDARKRHHLSHADVQMARELDMNPKTPGKLDNHGQEPWKLPLPGYIEQLYFERFGKRRPDVVVSMEELAGEFGGSAGSRGSRSVPPPFFALEHFV